MLLVFIGGGEGVSPVAALSSDMVGKPAKINHIQWGTHVRIAARPDHPDGPPTRRHERKWRHFRRLGAVADGYRRRHDGGPGRQGAGGDGGDHRHDLRPADQGRRPGVDLRAGQQGRPQLDHHRPRDGGAAATRSDTHSGDARHLRVRGHRRRWQAASGKGMKLAALAVAAALAPATALAHPHIVVSQAVRAIEGNGAYTHVEVVWKFDPHASEDEIPAIDEDKDGKFSTEEIRLLIRDTMPGFVKVGFLTWLN